MPTEEKKELLSAMNAVELITLYKYYSNNFNPFDADFCESFELVKAEIRYRLEAYDCNCKGAK